MQIPKSSKETNVTELSGIKALVNRKMKKSVPFMDSEVVITKLSVSQVFEVQDESAKRKDDDNGLEIVKKVIAIATEGGSLLTDEDFRSFPMDELSNLANTLMEFSGVSGGEGKAS